MNHNILTNYQTPWSRAQLERPPIVQPAKKFPAFYDNRRFITAFTRALHLSYPDPDHCSQCQPQIISPRAILILSTHLRLDLPSGPFPSSFSTNNLYAFLFSRIRSTCLTQLIFFEHSNYTCRRVQITKLLVMQFSASSRYFIPLRSKYPPQ
jgi:hypothetical protein